jgi:electron transfer flavoprotein alpha subunit
MHAVLTKQAELAGDAFATDVDLETMRRQYAAERAFWNEGGPTIARTVDDVVPGPSGDVRVRVHVPHPGTAGRTNLLPCIVYLHGGGFVVGDLDTHDRIVRTLAELSGAAVVGVCDEHPEHPRERDRKEPPMSTTYVLVAGAARIASLVAAAPGPVAAVVVGDRETAVQVAGTPGVASVVGLGDPGPAPFEAFGAPVADGVEAARPGAVLAATRPAERVLAGAAAPRLAAPVLTLVSELVLCDDGAEVTRGVVGGIARENVRIAGPVVVLGDGGGLAEGGNGVIEEAAAAPSTALEVRSTEPAAQAQVDLVRDRWDGVSPPGRGSRGGLRAASGPRGQRVLRRRRLRDGRVAARAGDVVERTCSTSWRPRRPPTAGPSSPRTRSTGAFRAGRRTRTR